MGLGLNGCQIDATYPGLIKTCDNSAVTSTYKPITDGNGNDLPLQVSSLGTKFTGDADFTGATVTGIPAGPTGPTGAPGPTGAQGAVGPTGPGGAAGLVNDASTDSIKNADSLVTLAACAGGQGSISLGNGATSDADGVIVIGCAATSLNGTAYGGNAVIIGCGATGQAFAGSSVALGSRTCVSSLSIAIGDESKSNSYGISIGSDNPNGTGYMVQSSSTLIGSTGRINGDFGVGLGRCSCSNVGCGTALGARSCINTLGTCGGAFGFFAQSNAASAYAIGYNVTATRANALTTCEIELCTAGGGLYLTTPDGLAQPKISVDNSCALLVDGTPVGGGGGAAGLESGTGTDSMQSAASLTTVAANAAGACSIALGNGASVLNALTGNSIAIGTNATTCKSGSIAIGTNAFNNGNVSIVIGNGACAPGLDEQIAIGLNAISNSNAGGIALGRDASASGLNGTAIGRNSCSWFAGVALGFGATASTSSFGEGTAVGNSAQALHRSTTALGDRACVTGERGIAIGAQANTAVTDGIAIGTSVSATRSGALTTCEYVACVAGQGLVVTSPDGLTTLGIGIDNSGNIVTYTP